jgi:hypothetical protein
VDLWHTALDTEHSGTLAVEDEVSTLFTLGALGERHGAALELAVRLFVS